MKRFHIIISFVIVKMWMLRHGNKSCFNYLIDNVNLCPKMKTTHTHKLTVMSKFIAFISSYYRIYPDYADLHSDYLPNVRFFSFIAKKVVLFQRSEIMWWLLLLNRLPKLIKVLWENKNEWDRSDKMKYIFSTWFLRSLNLDNSIWWFGFVYRSCIPTDMVAMH